MPPTSDSLVLPPGVVPSSADAPGGKLSFGEWFEGFFSLDLRSLAVFRIALAVILLVDLGIRYTDLEVHYSDGGLAPPAGAGLRSTGSVHCLSGSATFQACLFFLHALFAVALLVGLYTRLATFACCYLLISLHFRNPLILQGGDSLLRLLLFWGMFLPLGARCSLDSLRASRPFPSRVISFASVALILQTCFLYWFSFALKTDPSWRSEGTAVYYALSIDQLVTPLGKTLLDYPGLMRFLTFATLGLELLGPALLFFPWRREQVRLVVVALFLAFHLVGLNLCLRLGPFPYVCAAAWVAILPGIFWDRIGGHRYVAGTRRGLVLRLPLGLNLLCAFFLAYVFLWNLRSIDYERFGRLLPQEWNRLGFVFGLDQYWTMFAPHPPTDDGWYVAAGTLQDGQTVDLLRGGTPVSWGKPELVSSLYKNEALAEVHDEPLPRGPGWQPREPSQLSLVGVEQDPSSGPAVDAARTRLHARGNLAELPDSRTPQIAALLAGLVRRRQSVGLLKPPGEVRAARAAV